MSSHLARQDGMLPVRALLVLPNAMLRKLTLKIRYPHFLVVRNPYQRLESFYRSKLLAAKEDIRETGRLQRCQLILLKALDYDHPDLSTAEAVLLRLSFAEFVRLLPLVYLKDGHLQPQSRKIYLTGMYQRCLRIESQEDLSFMGRVLKIDTSYKTGSSQHISSDEIFWSQDDTQTVNSLYDSDFACFGYSKAAVVPDA